MLSASLVAKIMQLCVIIMLFLYFLGLYHNFSELNTQFLQKSLIKIYLETGVKIRKFHVESNRAALQQN